METNEKVDGFISCSICKKVLAFSPKSGTGNAIVHLKKHESAAVTMDNFVVKKGITVSRADKTNLIETCVDFVAKDMRPFETLNGEGLLDFARNIWNLGVKYGSISREEIADIIPHPTTVSNNATKKANVKKCQMRSLLHAAVEWNPFVAITCDVWQDDYRKLSYLGVTAHFHNQNQTLCDQIIALQPLDSKRKKDHAYIRETTKDVLEKKGLPFDPEKVVFVTDRGGNMKKGLRGFQRLNCFPHFTNNIVKASCKIDYIRDILKACSELVRYMKISGHNNELETTVKAPVNTRFNSYLRMSDSIIENWEALKQILERENETSRLDRIDLSVLKQIRSFLVPFKHWSDYTESSKKASLYAVWIGVDSLIKHCTVNAEDEHLTAMMKTKALSYIEKSFELHIFHRVSTFLHPNFKSLRFASQNLYQRTAFVFSIK